MPSDREAVLPTAALLFRNSGDDPLTAAQGYVLGQTAGAARRLEIQDAHFAEASELLPDELALRPHDRVVELGCGPGGFSRRILGRLGEGGVLVGVDRSESLLAQASSIVAITAPREAASSRGA